MRKSAAVGEKSMGTPSLSRVGRTQLMRAHPGWGNADSGNVLGLMSPNLCGPCHIIHRASKFEQKLDKSSLGGEVYAFSEMLDHMSMLRERYGNRADRYSGMVGLGDCESLFLRISEGKR